MSREQPAPVGDVARFDLPSPHVLQVTVSAKDIDAYNHVNNAVYLVWCDHCAWHHSATLGLPIARCLQLDRGMAVLRTVIAYTRSALLGDELQVATWLLPGSSKLCVRRRFQIVRTSDAVTLARADIEYACIQLSSGRPSRWPVEFHAHYRPLPEVVAAAQALPPL